LRLNLLFADFTDKTDLGKEMIYNEMVMTIVGCCFLLGLVLVLYAGRSPSTTISYNLAADSQVELTVYNIKGQKVKSLVNDTQQAGTRNVDWNCKDDNNNPVSSGIYFYKIKTDADVKMSKMILLK